MKDNISLNITNLPDYQLNKVVDKLNEVCINKGWKIELLKKKEYTHLIYEGKEEIYEQGFINKGWKLTTYTAEKGQRAKAIKVNEFLKL